jgi:hypothetical protein
MTALLSLVGIGSGALLVLVGLVMIAAQVRVHQIEVYSIGSWVFRVGAVLSLFGLILMATGDGSGAELGRVGLLTGVTGFLGGLFVWNHEREQALHEGAEHWDWPRSLTLQLVGLGGSVFIAALLIG